MSLGIYVHLPFCRVHCTYCAFAISTDISSQERYVEALSREIDSRAVTGVAVDSVYFGGGTPSRMAVHSLAAISAQLRERFTLSNDVEFSMEANPEDVTSESLDEWRTLGVNRLSIGVQSFNDEELLPLGRLHGAARAREAVALAVNSGFRTNLDLILGLPQQTAESFLATIDTAIALGTGHISLYMLDLEPKSPLEVQVARSRVVLPEDDTVADLYVEAIRRLGVAGIHQYEISNFARPGEECRHNIRYWHRGDYFGVGMGAHSFVGGKRFANTRDIRRYIELSPHASDFSETLGTDEARRETLFLELRQTTGINYEDVERLCGQEGIEWMDRGLRDGWLRREGARVAFTSSGFLLSNELISQLF
jgi:oxygen-independent coproporphyrinogen-3 oxidase